MAMVVDEDDVEGPEPTRLPPGSVEVDGLLHVDDLADVVPDIALPEGTYETVGGFVMDQLGRMPWPSSTGTGWRGWWCARTHPPPTLWTTTPAAGRLPASVRA
jgi:CBS domain containing-hemolysin-like protein